MYICETVGKTQEPCRRDNMELVRKKMWAGMWAAGVGTVHMEKEAVSVRGALAGNYRMPN